MKKIKSFIIKVAFLCFCFSAFNGWGQTSPQDIKGGGGTGGGETPTLVSVDDPRPGDDDPYICINNLGSANCQSALCIIHGSSSGGNGNGSNKIGQANHYQNTVLSPNPVISKQFNVDLYLLEGRKCTFQMYDISGQQIHNWGMQYIKAGNQRIEFDLPFTITEGIYWIVIEGNEIREVINVMVY